MMMFVLAPVLGFSSPVHAGTVRMEFDSEIDQDNDPPEGNPPWLIATFKGSGLDTVLLTVESRMQAPDQSIKRLWFNTNDNIDADNLTIVQREGGPTVLVSDAVQDGFGGVNQKGQKIRGFDIKLKWNEFEFASNDVVPFDISGAGLTAESFYFLNNSGDYFFLLATAKIGGVDDPDEGDNHDELIAPTGVPVPAPDSPEVWFR